MTQRTNTLMLSILVAGLCACNGQGANQTGVINTNSSQIGIELFPEVQVGVSFNDAGLQKCLEHERHSWKKEGLVYAHQVKTFSCTTRFSPSIEELDVFSHLEKLSLQAYNIKELNLTAFPHLNHLDLYSRELLTIDWGNATNLQSISLSSPNIKELDLTTLPQLNHLYIKAPELLTIDWGDKPSLQSLSLDSFQGEPLFLNDFPQLNDLHFSSAGKQSPLSIGQLPALTRLSVESAVVNELTLAKTPKLTELIIQDSAVLPNLSFADAPHLRELLIFSSQQSTLDLSDNKALETLFLKKGDWKTLNLPTQSSLTSFGASETQLSHLDLSSSKKLRGIYINNNPNLSELSLPEVFSDLRKWDLKHNMLTHFPQSSFPQLKELNLSGNPLTSLSLANMPALTNLYYRGDNSTPASLQTLDLSIAPALEWAEVSGAGLQEISIGNLPLLSLLNLNNNRLTQLQLDQVTALEQLMVSTNQLSELNTMNNTELTRLEAAHNHVSELPLVHLPELQYLNVSDNQLQHLDLSHLTWESFNSSHLLAADNQLKSISFPLAEPESALVIIDALDLSGNQLTELNFANTNFFFLKLILHNNPDLNILFSAEFFTKIFSWTNTKITCEVVNQTKFIDDACLPTEDE